MRLGLAGAAALALALAGWGCSSDEPTIIELDMQAPMPDAGPDGGSDLDGGTQDGGEVVDPNARTVTIGPGGLNKFSPQTTFVPAGGTVTWLWVTGVHGVVSDDLPPAFPASPTQAGGRYTATFSTPGQFGYHCAVHGTMMTGVVVVE